MVNVCVSCGSNPYSGSSTSNIRLICWKVSK